MKVTYFPVRGACRSSRARVSAETSVLAGRVDPILLLLVDGGIQFELETVGYEEWAQLKEKGENGPPRFPFNAMPTLTHNMAGREEVLAEEAAILTFVEQSSSSTLSAQRSAEHKARIEQLRSASMFVCNKLWTMATDEQWLAPPRRDDVLKQVILPFLRSLEWHLASNIFPPIVHPPPKDHSRPGTTLTAAAAAATSAIDFMCDLFPKALSPEAGGPLETLFPQCHGLCKHVHERPRIEAWIKKGGRVDEWTGRPYGRLAYVREMADKHDAGDAALAMVQEMDKAKATT